MKAIDINIDFDGTCVTHSFPLLGKDIGAVPVLKRLVKEGHRLILFTMRSDTTAEHEINDWIKPGDFLTQAVQWFKVNDIPLYGVQTNPTQSKWTNSPKSYAALMIDDSALGCPLIYNEEVSSRAYVDWVKVEKMLEDLGVLTKK